MKLNNKQRINTDFWQGTMSDIAFLLIIFFILTALFSTPYILRFMTSSEHRSLINEKELITLKITEDGTWNINNRIISKNELSATLDKEKKYRIKVHDKRPYQDFISILNLFHEKQIYQVDILTEE